MQQWVAWVVCPPVASKVICFCSGERLHPGVLRLTTDSSHLHLANITTNLLERQSRSEAKRKERREEKMVIKKAEKEGTFMSHVSRSLPPVSPMVFFFFSLLLFQLHTLTSFGVTSFTTPSSYQSDVTSSYYYRYRAVPRIRVATTLDFSNPVNENGKQELEASNNDSIDGKDIYKENFIDRSVTLLERARIISYRIAISASALCLCVQAVDDIGFLEGTGANINQLVEQSAKVLPIFAGSTICFCPVPRNKIVEIGSISLGLAAIGSGLVSAGDDIQQLAGGISWNLSILTLMAVSIREVYYFGVEYKQECVITILMLALMFDHNNHVPFTIPLCALGMSVLAAGKLFEPCQEDLIPSNSEFLAK